MLLDRIYPGGEMWPVISADNAIQEAYEAMRREGQSHNVAEMCALQVAPTGNTDATFLAGHCNGNQFEKHPAIGDFYEREAAAAGVNVKGKVYKSGLARFPGDPEAWINSKDDIKNICEKRGWGCQGSVNVAVDNSRTPIADVDVAADIVRDKVLDNVARDPALAVRPLEELKEQAKEQLLPFKAPEVTFEQAFAAAAA